jgi:hypothetical protein
MSKLRKVKRNKAPVLGTADTHVRDFAVSQVLSSPQLCGSEVNTRKMNDFKFYLVQRANANHK